MIIIFYERTINFEKFPTVFVKNYKEFRPKRYVAAASELHRARQQNGDNNKNNKKKVGNPGLKEGLLDGGVPKGGRAVLEKSIVLFQMQ